MTAPDPNDFPKPEAWGTYVEYRTPKFKKHRTPGLCKSALTNMGLRDPKHWRHAANQEAYVYRFDPDLDAWVEFAHVHHGDLSFFDIKDPGRKPKTLPQEKVDEAFALVREAMLRQNDKVRQNDADYIDGPEVERARLEQHDELLTSVQTEED